MVLIGLGTIVLRGWELRYNYYILICYAAPAMFPTTYSVFLQLTVLLFDYCILVLCISQTEWRTDVSPQVGLVHTFTLNSGVMWD